jgi:hypothetical protein
MPRPPLLRHPRSSLLRHPRGSNRGPTYEDETHGFPINEQRLFHKRLLAFGNDVTGRVGTRPIPTWLQK